LYAHNEDDIDEDLWKSPSKKDNNSNASKGEQSGSSATGPQVHTGKTKYDDGESKEAALRNELQSVRKVNEAIEGVIDSLNKAQSSMKSVNQTVNSASILLNTWTRILSQTEHNQRLILNPAWQGASQDHADQEQEVYARQQAAERRELEEQERRAAAAKRAEDEERRKAEAATRTSNPSQRGKGRPPGRATNTTQATTPGYVPMGGQGTKGGSRGSSTGARRTTSGIGRGIGSGRGRGAGS